MDLIVLSGVAGGTFLLVIYLFYASYELKIRARNTTAVFLNNGNKYGRKSIISPVLDDVPLDPKVSPGYNNPLGRKFTVARASHYIPQDAPTPMIYGSQGKIQDKSLWSKHRVEEW